MNAVLAKLLSSTNMATREDLLASMPLWVNIDSWNIVVPANRSAPAPQWRSFIGPVNHHYDGDYLTV